MLHRVVIVRDIRSFFFRNYKAKIAVLIIAVLLWVFITTSAEYEATFDIPLVVVGKKSNKVLVDPIPTTVKVLCRDTGKRLLMFQFFSDAVLRLDLSTISYFYDYPLSVDQIRLPGGFHPHQLRIESPDTVEIRLDDLEKATVPIRLRANLIPKAGYVLAGAPRLSQDSVTISGARRYVRSLREVPTDSVVFSDVTGHFHESLHLRVDQPGLEYSVDKVEVAAEVDRIGQIVFSKVPVIFEAIPQGRQVTAEPPTVEVTVKGAVSLLRGLRDTSVRAVINVQQVWQPGVKLYQPEVRLPSGVDLVGISPDRVQLNVRKTG